MPITGDALTSKFLSDYQRVLAKKNVSEKGLSTGELQDPSLKPVESTYGQDASAKIAAFTTVAQQTVEAGTLCSSIISAISSGIDLLTEQVELATFANTDASDARIKSLYDNSFQNALKAFEVTMENFRWNDAQILTNTASNVSSLNSLGIYNPTAGNTSTAFNFGPPTPEIASFYDLAGLATGAVGTINNTGASVSVAIGTQTFTVDTTALTLAIGDTLTLTDAANNNKISFKIGSNNPTPAQIATGINSILNGLQFSPNISNLHPVTNFFTGGVNYNYTKGNYTGTPTEISVENIANQLKITIKMSQGAGQEQYFTATIPQPTAGSTLILNSSTNQQNSIAFNFSSSLTPPLTPQALETALGSLLGINGAQASFTAMATDSYPGMSINATNGATQGTYGLNYTVLGGGQAQFALNSGDKTYVQKVNLPLREQDVISFSNGISIKLTDLSLFQENQSKAQSLFTISQGSGNNTLYFQTGIRSDEQLAIYPPTLTIDALGLLGSNVKTNTEATITGAALRQAITILSAELERMAEIAKTIDQKNKYAELSAQNFEEIRSTFIGTDTIAELIAVTESEAQGDVIHAALAKELQRKAKLIELLKSI
jgi:hypothetical protein